MQKLFGNRGPVRSHLASVVLLGLFAGCRGSGATDADSSSTIRERWHQEQPGYSGSAQPAVSGDLVHFGTADGYVVARARTTGAQHWVANVGAGAAVQGANLLARQGVVVAPVVSWTFGLDAASGRELWRYESPPDVPDNPQRTAGQLIRTHIDADDEAVYVGAWGASVSALDLHSGAVRWVWKTPDTASFRSGSMGVRVRGDTVYATVWHHTARGGGSPCEPWVVALHRRTGAELWRVVLPATTTGTCVWGAPALWGDLVFIATLDGYLYAVDGRTRAVAWKQRLNVQWAQVSQPEVRGDIVYADGGDGHFYARRAADGGLVWSARYDKQITTDPLVTERRVYISNGPNLFIFDRQTGRLVTMTQPPYGTRPSFGATPAAVDGQVFAPVSGGAWSFQEP